MHVSLNGEVQVGLWVPTLSSLITYHHPTGTCPVSRRICAVLIQSTCLVHRNPSLGRYDHENSRDRLCFVVVCVICVGTCYHYFYAH